MIFNTSCFISEYGLRTNENRRFLQDLSDIYRDHNQELKILSEISEKDTVLEDIRDVVNTYTEKDISTETLKALFKLHRTHELRARQEYLNLQERIVQTGNQVDISIPEHLYFDGTQLINSLYGLIVLPLEGYKDTQRFREYEEKMERYSRDEYMSLKNYILEVRQSSLETGIYDLEHGFPYKDKVYLSNYGDTNRRNGHANPVMAFLHHLRNSLAHSGNGNIHFFPLSADQGGKSVTHMVFYDTYTFTNRNNIENTYHFYVKMPINDVIHLAKIAQPLFASLNNTNLCPFTHQQIIDRINHVDFRINQ